MSTPVASGVSGGAGLSSLAATSGSLSIAESTKLAEAGSSAAGSPITRGSCAATTFRFGGVRSHLARRRWCGPARRSAMKGEGCFRVAFALFLGCFPVVSGLLCVVSQLQPLVHDAMYSDWA